MLGGSTVDALSVALCCASIAAPIPEIRSLKVRNTLDCNYEKMACIYSSWFKAWERTTCFKLGQDVEWDNTTGMKDAKS